MALAAHGSARHVPSDDYPSESRIEAMVQADIKSHDRAALKEAQEDAFSQARFRAIDTTKKGKGPSAGTPTIVAQVGGKAAAAGATGGTGGTGGGAAKSEEATMVLRARLAIEGSLGPLRNESQLEKALQYLLSIHADVALTRVRVVLKAVIGDVLPRIGAAQGR